MKRNVIEELIRWKKENRRIPILLTGAKGVGKTYLAYDFAKAFFEGVFYLNFQRNQGHKTLFVAGDTIETVQKLKEFFAIDKENENITRILILDEIGCCEEAMGLLQTKDFTEEFPYVLCISSSPITGKGIDGWTRLSIHPLEFDEFLVATGNEWYIDLIRTHYNNNSKLPEIVHKELLDLFHLYLVVGGMPGSINEYLALNCVINIPEKHSHLMGSYHDMILNEISESDSFKMVQVLDSVSQQLIKENKKFQYKLIRKGTTHSMYKDAIKKLTDYQIVIRSNRVSPELLSGSDNNGNRELFANDDTCNSFKLYLLDTGILNTKITDEGGVASNKPVKQALLENYLAQSLRTKNYHFGFWESESMAKIDFIIEKEGQIIPLEVHIDGNTRSKSLSVLKQRYQFPYAIKVSAKNFEAAGQIKYVPYYAVFCI